MTSATINTPGTLRELLPAYNREHSKRIAISIDATLVVGFALLTAALAQVSFSLSFTPVPITGQTLGVLLSGAALGLRLGASSQILYLVMGAVGLPFYSEGASGLSVLKGATGGYVVGFIFASALIGFLAERGNDRKISSAIGSFLLGSLVIYFFGSLWLAHTLEIPVWQGPKSAIALGIIPFLFGDLLKAIGAGVTLPGSWKLVSLLRKDDAIKES